VAGLRREEVALLAGVSVDYYSRLERGNLAGASEGVLEALADALQLDEAERAHLFDLARAANARPNPTRGPRRPAATRIRPGCTADTGCDHRRTGMDPQWTHGLPRREPARDRAPLLNSAARPTNSARFMFLDPAAKDFYVDWDGRPVTRWRFFEYFVSKADLAASTDFPAGE
jgi:hypothetical protein